MAKLVTQTEEEIDLKDREYIHMVMGIIMESIMTEEEINEIIKKSSFPIVSEFGIKIKTVLDKFKRRGIESGIDELIDFCNFIVKNLLDNPDLAVGLKAFNSTGNQIDNRPYTDL